MQWPLRCLAGRALCPFRHTVYLMSDVGFTSTDPHWTCAVQKMSGEREKQTYKEYLTANRKERARDKRCCVNEMGNDLRERRWRSSPDGSGAASETGRQVGHTIGATNGANE